MNRFLLIAAGCFLAARAFSQNNPPVAITDTVKAISQMSLMIDVLENDYDPDGDAISLKSWSTADHGTVDTINGKIMYLPENFSGRDYFYYRIIDNNPGPLTSLYTKALISVSLNPDAPVAIPDTLHLLEIDPVEVNLLENDWDPNGDEFNIKSISDLYCKAILNLDSTIVTIIPDAGTPQAFVYYTLQEKNTAGALLSSQVKVNIKVLPNPDIPVAIDDSATTTGGVPVVIPVMENDYDPQGEPIEIYKLYGSNGNAVQDGDSLIYTPAISIAGLSRISYTIREVNDTAIASERAWVNVNVTRNSSCPVGEPDFATGMTGVPMSIDVLSNDHGTLVDGLEIYDIKSEGNTSVNGNFIEYTSSPLTLNQETMLYRIRNIHHKEYYSDWTPVYITLNTNPDLPLALDDYISTKSGFSVDIRPIDNDLRNAADSLIVVTSVSLLMKGRLKVLSDSIVSYTAFGNAKGRDTIKYLIKDKWNHALVAAGFIFIDVKDHHFYDSLVINNINAGVHGDGFLFSNPSFVPGQAYIGNYSAHFKFPAGSENSTILNSTLWIGAMDDQGLCFAGEEYKSAGSDFQAGPVSDNYDTAYASRYLKVWKLNKADVEFHRNNWWKEGYEPLEVIASWPGDGDPELGQAEHLAPYTDVNSDGVYNSLEGDFPLIRGDQCIFFISNDDMEHAESGGQRLKVEVHGMVYGFDAPDDSALWNTVFVHYDVINRSAKTYHDAYMAMFTDFDIGNPWNDNIGTEVTRSSFYAFNGTKFDDEWYSYGDDQTHQGYGMYPPAQSVTVLAGPFMDPDGIDDPSGGCDYSVNGTNFGNDNIDDERFGLCRSVMYWNNSYGYWYNAPDFYKLMNGRWPEDLPWQYGSLMGYTDPMAVGPDCNIIFPGASDPLNWGTNCIIPNGGYNQNEKYWTDSTTLIPNDRRGVAIMGPFTFEPGQVQEIDLAYVAANGWNGAQSSVDKLMEYIDTLRARVDNGEIIIPNNSLGTRDQPKYSGQMKIYPNPANDFINIVLPGSVPTEAEYLIFDILGKNVITGKLMNVNKFSIQVGNLRAGFYVMVVRSNEMISTSKFIKTGNTR